MTFKRFRELLLASRPNIFSVSQHSAYANTRQKQAVGIVFNEGGKVYEYTESYTSILESLGIMRKCVVMYAYEAGRPLEEYTAFYTEAEAMEFITREKEREERG